MSAKAQSHQKTLFDVLSLPLIGRFLKWRHGRLTIQIIMILLTLLLVYDGFTGPQRAAENLATVAPWVHYRGLIVLALLLVGNLFCMGCPFTVSRTLAKRLSISGRRFPRRLRNKWLAIASLLLIFFLYEWLNLWASPMLTAWVIVTYFILSFVLEAIFEESAFCKYVCPLGTFNFVYSTASPTQITSKNLDICRSCVGKECVNGSYADVDEPIIRIDSIPMLGGASREFEVVHSRQGTLGCGTELFVPQITSNMDCVLCLDCVRACPHDNVALAVRTPGRELLQPRTLPQRWDIAYLLIAITCMGLVNAFGMIPPVYDLLQDLATGLGLTQAQFPDSTIEAITLAMIFITGGLILPAVLLWGATKLSQLLAGAQKKYKLRQIASEFAPAFVPLGLGIWIAHYGFHFLIGALSIIPVFQSFLIDHRITLLGERPNWSLGGIHDLTLISGIQVAVMLTGFAWSMLIANRVSERIYRRQATLGFIPWALTIVFLMALAMLIFNQPMEMRGTILFD